MRDDVVFTISGDRIPERFTLATLADYDGRVWTVGSTELGGSAPFVPLDTSRRCATCPTSRIRSSSPLLPSASTGYGSLCPGSSNRLSGVAATKTCTDPIQHRTGTLAFPDGVAGEQLVVDVRPQPVLTPDQHATITITSGAPLEVAGQTAVIRSRSADIVEGVEQGWPQVEAIQSALRPTASTSSMSGTDPGHSWGTPDRLLRR